MLAAMDVHCVNYLNVRILVMVAASASLRFLRHCLDKAEHTRGNRLRSQATMLQLGKLWHTYVFVFCMYIGYTPEAGRLTAFYGSLGGISRVWKWNVDLK